MALQIPDLSDLSDLSKYLKSDAPLISNSDIDILFGEIGNVPVDQVEQASVDNADIANLEDAWGDQNPGAIDLNQNGSPRPDEEDPLYPRMPYYQEPPKLKASFDETLSNRICYKRGTKSIQKRYFELKNIIGGFFQRVVESIDLSYKSMPSQSYVSMKILWTI